MFDAIRTMLNRKNRAIYRALDAEAKRRGLRFEELQHRLTPRELSDIVENALPQPDLRRWGLVPREQLVDRESSGIPAVEAATAAAAGGDWRPAAALMVDSYGSWDYRAHAVHWLAEAAAADQRWLAAWRAERPEDRHAEVVECAALVARAWQLRGSEWATETTREQFDGFRRVLADAEPAAERAARALPDDPTPWATLVTIARGRSYDHARFDQVWRGLLERAPLHQAGHRSALQYWCAKWYGSDELMFAFAEQAAERSPALSVLLLQAAFEQTAFAEQDGDRPVWRQPRVQHALNTLLRWLDTDGANGASVRDDLGWAAWALVESGRGAEAVPIFRRLGDYAGGAPWWHGHSPAYLFNKYRVRACEAAK